MIDWAEEVWRGIGRGFFRDGAGKAVSVPLLALLVAAAPAGAADSVNLGWTLDTFQVRENDGPMAAVVKLSSAIPHDVEVTFSVTDGTATYDDDFKLSNTVSNTVIFIAAGQVTAGKWINIICDGIEEGTEDFTLTIEKVEVDGDTTVNVTGKQAKARFCRAPPPVAPNASGVDAISDPR